MHQPKTVWIEATAQKLGIGWVSFKAHGCYAMQEGWNGYSGVDHNIHHRTWTYDLELWILWVCLVWGLGFFFWILHSIILHSRNRQLYVKLLCLCMSAGLRRSLGDQKSFPTGAHQDGALLCVLPLSVVCGFLAYFSNSHSSAFFCPIYLCFKHIFVSLYQGPARKTETTPNI